MTIRYEAISETGKIRRNNEDMALVFNEFVRDSAVSFSFDMPDGIRFTAIVSDGMGGFDNGEIASEMATRSFSSFLSTLSEGLDENEVILHVKQWVKDINREIIDNVDGTRMGCTFSGIFIYENKAFLLNIGDSRVYRIRYEHFKQLTTDHSERNRTGDDSIPSNLIYNALGIDNAFIDIVPTYLVPGDKYIICSDGLYDMIDDSMIEKIITSGGGARQLVNAAINAGGEDNVTVIILHIS
ncbi:MAG: serine/threonine-protein phosphatase [Muribaculaceae bacterium]|nr:serine/threonine-protein phosphatase [Muribaculaceae bacterium]